MLMEICFILFLTLKINIRTNLLCLYINKSEGLA